MTATLTTLASFDSADGRAPYRNLIADAHGDLLGTTSGGGANDHGTVFEMPRPSVVARAPKRRDQVGRCRVGARRREAAPLFVATRRSGAVNTY
jgi:arginase family enzyme